MIATFLAKPGECLMAGSQVQGTAFDGPASTDAFQSGLAALKENRLEEALKQLTAAERERPNDALARNFRGIVLARLGRSREAAAEYDEAIRIDPRMEAAYRNLGFLEWMEHRLDAASEQLKHALELSPDDSFAHYYLGRVQLDARLFENAFEELHRANMTWPDDPEFRIAAATGYLALGRQAEARTILGTLATEPLSDAQSARLGWLLLGLHDKDGAIRLLERWSNPRQHHSAPWARFDLALAYLMAGSYQQAADHARRCADSFGHAATTGRAAGAWSVAGIAEARMGNVQPAVNALRRAATLDPTQEEHWLNLTRELLELSRYADAISASQEGLGSSPRSYALHLRLGAANLAAGRYEEAAKIFRTLADAGDPLPTSYVGLAQVLLRTGHAEEAATELAEAQKRLGPNFLFSYFRGLALDRAGLPLEAISAFEEAVQQDPQSAEAHLALGKTELVGGRVADAIVQFEETLRINPGDVQAQRLLRQAYRRSGDAKSAAKYAEPPVAAPVVAPVAEGGLLGDFFLPQWQEPSAERKH